MASGRDCGDSDAATRCLRATQIVRMQGHLAHEMPHPRQLRLQIDRQRHGCATSHWWSARSRPPPSAARASPQRLLQPELSRHLQADW